MLKSFSEITEGRHIQTKDIINFTYKTRNILKGIAHYLKWQRFTFGQRKGGRRLYIYYAFMDLFKKYIEST